MALERELKIIGADLGAARDRLQSLGAKCQGRRFESNEVFDRPGGELKAGGRLLRLRRDGRNILTFKEPATAAKGDAGRKVMDEYETGVADAGEMRRILIGLGYAESFVYEKFRETWMLGGCEVCLDVTPLGEFVELSGAEGELEAALDELGLSGLAATDESYHAINARMRAGAGLPLRDGFSFSDRDRKRLMAEWGVAG